MIGSSLLRVSLLSFISLLGWLGAACAAQGTEARDARLDAQETRNAEDASATVSFAGTWQTTYGPLHLIQAGQRVRGQYGSGGEGAALQGVLEGSRLTFRYEEEEAEGEGWFELGVSTTEFHGLWREDGDEEWQEWSGQRPQGTDPTRFVGLWRTNLGRLRLSPAGAEILGLLDAEGGTPLRGRVAGRKLDLRCDAADAIDATGAANATGGAESRAELILGEDGQTFTGAWIAADGAASAWEGRRIQPDLARPWLVVLEAHWETSLFEEEYSYGAMLRSYFARLPRVRFRHRFIHDAADLVRFGRELAFEADPVILYLSSHGTEEGLSLADGTAGADELLAALAHLPRLTLLHFGACLVMEGEVPRQIAAARDPARRFPISGFRREADWAGSAITDFTYLELILGQGLSPRDAAAATRAMVSFARAESGGPIEGSDLAFYDPNAEASPAANPDRE